MQYLLLESFDDSLLMPQQNLRVRLKPTQINRYVEILLLLQIILPSAGYRHDANIALSFVKATAIKAVAYQRNVFGPIFCSKCLFYLVLFIFTSSVLQPGP